MTQDTLWRRVLSQVVIALWMVAALVAGATVAQLTWLVDFNGARMMDAADAGFRRVPAVGMVVDRSVVRFRGEE